MDAFTEWKGNSRRGNYSLLMGTTVFVFLGFAALAVDISLITMSELQAQATADAASHAALVAYRQNKNQGEGNMAAAWVVGANKIGLGTGNIDTIRYGTYDHQTTTFCVACSPTGNVNAVEVELSRQGGNAVDLLLAPVLGINTHDVDARAITAQQQRALMLVQDMSCSMMWGAAIDVSRDANLVFLDYLVDFPQDGDMLGLSMYAFLGARAPEAGGGGTNTMNDASWAQLVEVGSSLPYLTSRIGGICDTAGPNPCPATGQPHPTDAEIGGCTNPGIAMEQAIDQIRDNTDRTYFRGMLVMSDGVFNCGGSPQRAYDAANLAWGTYDISIWSVLFHNGTFSPVQMQNLVRGIGFFQMSPNAADLPVMYEEVAKSLPTAIVD